MLRETHHSSVTEDQIDHLGHMNVRFYAANALAGTRAVVADLPGWADRGHEVHDIYTRHHREQLLGTRLVLRSAVLRAAPEAVRIHHELADAETGQLAATFVHGVSPLADDGRRLLVSDETIAAVRGEAIDLPDYAATRTISLDADLVSTAPDLATLLERDLAFRKPRTVDARECDEQGNYRLDMAAALTWGGEQTSGDAPDSLREMPGGELMGWASMETRAVFGELPSVGDRIQSFAASVAMHDKVVHRVNWAFDLDTGVLLTAFESVSMAFDLRGRRPMSIPEGYRRAESARLHADLAPRAVA